jgi:hypothetical protein
VKPSEAKKYQTWDGNCYKLECFVPFSGNGQKICRLYELGRCPPENKRKVVKQND